MVTIIFATIYVSVQQSYRQTANDPQIQIAEDMADQLKSNGVPIPLDKTDISRSLSPFVINYDDHGKVLFSTAVLNSKTPEIPGGVLENVKNIGQSRLTWEPSPGNRYATVISRYDGANKGYVLVGRSLREIEIRESNLEAIVAMAWLMSLFVLGACAYLVRPRSVK